MTGDADSIAAIRNLGQATARDFAMAGIHDAAALRALGADAAYLRLLAAGIRPHFIGYYALVLGLQGRPWNDCTGDEKTALRRRFDALKAEAAAKGGPKSDSRMDALLAEIGVIARRRGAG